MATIGLWLCGALAVGIIVIGMRFIFMRTVAAAGYGVAAPSDAYLEAKGIRDIASGLFVGILILNGSVHLLGGFILAATIVPLADMAIVLGNGGTRAAAFGIHGATVIAMLITCGLLLLSQSELQSH